MDSTKECAAASESMGSSFKFLLLFLPKKKHIRNEEKEEVDQSRKMPREVKVGVLRLIGSNYIRQDEATDELVAI